ncbi:MAG: hypothetical protein AAGM36_19110, partial [Cyanobacteria bacterium J06597_1]
VRLGWGREFERVSVAGTDANAFTCPIKRGSPENNWNCSSPFAEELEKACLRKIHLGFIPSVRLTPVREERLPKRSNIHYLATII